ncbi:hypothetical protein [Saccharopolyspora sp. NPDC050642]|uniref:NucA/NucB deoxyribonuclease domain-containing protein n=1 Tax=Saccharopolyspora sp. NPDC050642 TaxID=3157099 RepID=UPI0033E2462E
MNAPANPVLIIDHAENALFGRCDNVNNRFGAGCVDQEGMAYVLYDVRDNPLVEDVAKHVFDAIRTLPSHWGSGAVGGNPLTRLTSEERIDANRNVACGNAQPPVGYSCDEYPMASTYQGGDGAAPNDRSTRDVLISANNS